MADYPREEVQKAVEALHSTRAKADTGETGWDALADMFTEDATFIDPGWGRFKGREAIRQFLSNSMQGIDDWKFPILWTAIDGNRVIIKCMNRLPGQRPDGKYYEVPCLSTLEYAGNGKFSFEEDMINMVHLREVLKECGWAPGPQVKFPDNVVR